MVSPFRPSARSSKALRPSSWVARSRFTTLISMPSINLDTTGTGLPTKSPVRISGCFGGQAGFGYKINPEYAVRFAVAYYDFSNVKGQVSSPCIGHERQRHLRYRYLAANVCAEGQHLHGAAQHPGVCRIDAAFNFQYYGPRGRLSTSRCQRPT